jgi:CheY-like chemotaxis protein
MSTPTILIVDDDAETRESLHEAFEMEGFRVETAADGRAALAKLTETHPCVVILDLIMPAMNGNDVYAVMKGDQHLASIPVIVSTSDPSRAPPGVLIMKKPINLDLMLETVRKLC